MKNKLCHLGFDTHSVFVSQDQNKVSCFKYDTSSKRCDFASFTDYNSASDYIFAPFDDMLSVDIITM